MAADRAHHFQVGDLVMVTVADTAMNPINTSKPRLRWQGPCEVVLVEPGAPSELHVRLVGDKTSPLSRSTGPVCDDSLVKTSM